MRAEDFLSVIKGYVQQFIKKIITLGTVDSGYVSGRPRIVFDGESSASTKTYPYLARYSPTANDRVLLIKAGSTWVVVDKIV